MNNMSFRTKQECFVYLKSAEQLGHDMSNATYFLRRKFGLKRRQAKAMLKAYRDVQWQSFRRRQGYRKRTAA